MKAPHPLREAPLTPPEPPPEPPVALLLRASRVMILAAFLPPMIARLCGSSSWSLRALGLALLVVSVALFWRFNRKMDRTLRAMGRTGRDDP